MFRAGLLALVAASSWGADAGSSTGSPPRRAAAPAAAASHPKFVIRYQGGPVMTGDNKVYAIYYGDFPLTGDRTESRAILDDFLAGMGATSTYAVNSTYTDGAGKPVPGTLGYDPATQSVLVGYPFGPHPSNGDIELVVAQVIRDGRLPLDDDGVYVVFTSPDAADRLGTCAFHHWNKVIVPGHSVKWASVPVFGGDKLQECSGSVYVFGEQDSPNGNLSADMAVDSAFHEISEAVTDPNGTGWLSDSGSVENGDPCNFNYGPTYLAANGTHANGRIGDRDFLYQRLWTHAQPARCANKP